MTALTLGAIVLDRYSGDTLATFFSDESLAEAVESATRWWATDPHVEVHPLTFDHLSALAARFRKCVACGAPGVDRGRVRMFTHKDWCVSLSDLPETSRLSWPKFGQDAETLMERTVGR